MTNEIALRLLQRLQKGERVALAWYNDGARLTLVPDFVDRINRRILWRVGVIGIGMKRPRWIISPTVESIQEHCADVLIPVPEAARAA